jgi:hypothetical protein
MPKQSSRKRTWVIALVSIAALGVVGALTLVGLAVYLFASNVDFANSTPDAAAVRFDTARAEVNRRERPSGARPESLHVMAWDPDDGRLVSARMPLWLLRLSDDATVDFSADNGDIVGDLDLDIADLDHHGPGLVLDYQEPNRERVLLWTE